MRPETSRRVRTVLLVVAALALVAAFLPRPETLPSSERLHDVPPEEDLVRVTCQGRRIVFDKRRGWFSAKGAEWFPSVVTRFVPGDYVEGEDGVLLRRRLDVGGPWWK